MKGLSAVNLIGAGRFNPTRILVDDHVQIFGDNGNGKSTLCRALLFFYLGDPDRSSYGLDPSKDDWPSYYLKEGRSYVVFEVSRGEDRSFHVAVSRPGTNIQFLFVDTEFNRDDYLEDTGPDSARIRGIDEIVERFDSVGARYEKVDSYSGFKERIYGIRPSPFNVLAPLPAKQDRIMILGQSIAGMFRASVGGVDKMDLEKFRSVLVSSAPNPQETQINIREVANNIRDFDTTYQAVEAYQKQQGHVDIMMANFGDIEAKRQELADLMRTFASRFKCITEAEVQQQHLQSKSQTELANIQKNRNILEAAYQARLTSLENNIGKLDQQIKAGEQTQKDFSDQGIAKKRKELDSLSGRKQKLEIWHERLRLLNRDFRTEEEWRQSQLNVLLAEQNASRAEFTENKDTIRSRAREKRESVQKENIARIAAVDAEQENQLAVIRGERTRLDQELNAVSADILAITSASEPADLIEGRRLLLANKQNLANERNRRGRIEAELRALNDRDKSESLELQGKGSEVQIRIQSSIDETKREKDKLETEKSAISERRTILDKQLAALDASLANYFQKELPNEWDSAARLLDKEVLFRSAESLVAKKSQDRAETVFGLSLNSGAVPSKANAFNRSQIDQELSGTKVALSEKAQQITSLVAALAASNHELESFKTNYEKEKADLLRSQSDRRISKQNELTAADNAIQSLGQQIEALDHQVEIRAREFQAGKLEQLEAKKSTQNRISGEKGNLEHRESELLKNIRIQRDQIHQEGRQRVHEIDADEKNGLSDFESQQNRRESEFVARQANIQKEFEEKLADKGVDTSEIQTLDQQIKELNGEIQRIEGFRDKVAAMEDRWQREVEPLPRLREELRRIEAEKQSQIKTHKTALDYLKDLETQETNSLDAVSKQIQFLHKDRQAGETFSSEFLENAGLLTSPDIEPAQPFNAGTLDELLRQIRASKRTEEDMHSTGRKSFDKFRTAFTSEQCKLFGWTLLSDPEIDWMIFASENLRPFKRNNVIGMRRQMLSEQFNVLVSKVSSQLDRFDAALGHVRMTARQLDSFLEKEKLMDVIDYIKVRVEDRGDRLLEALRKVAGLKEVHFGSGIRDLFAASASNSQVDKAIQVFADLSGEINRAKCDILTLEQCFEMEVKVSENGIEGPWESAIRSRGSHGTAYLIKMSIYLALLEIIRQGIFRDPSNSRIHCLFDEAGTISPRHIDAILKYAERKGITLVAAGQAQSSGAFASWFQVWKDSGADGPQFFGQEKAHKARNISWE